MKDASIIIAGILGMIIAIIHGYLGATTIVGPIENIHPVAKRLLHAVFFLSAVYWFVGGAILAAAPFYLSTSARMTFALIVAVMFLSGAAANFWATQGTHFGWALLVIAAVLAWFGRAPASTQ